MNTRVRLRNARTLLLGILAVGCTPLSGRDGGRERLLSSPQWDTVWIASAQSDAAILEPGSLTADSAATYVVDWSERHVVALRNTDGRKLWSAGRRGSGPGEFSELMFLGTTPDGLIAAIDQASRRMSYYARDGSHVRDVSLLRLGGAPESFCMLPDGNQLFASFAADSLIVLSRSGDRIRAIPKPSPVRDPKGGLNQVLLRSDAIGARCAAALYLGVGFSQVSLEGETAIHPYIEDVPLPTWTYSAAGADSLTSDALAALDTFVRGDTLWVLFEGGSSLQRRILDAYDLRSGRYLSSLTLPTRANKFAWAGDLLVLEAGQGDGTFALVAVRQRR